MNIAPDRPLRARFILAFWFPLAATWLMMAVEGPYVAAIIARMPDAAFNLAAYGVAFALGWLAESPIMMLLTASNALVHDRQSFLALRRFTRLLNAGVTAVLLVGVTPPVFAFLTGRLIGLPPEVARLAHIATALLIPWPAAIGYRRFYQGILVRHHLTRRVAYGTVVRLTFMSVTAAGLAWTTTLPGAAIGAMALTAGVVAEAAASRWMARQIVAQLLAATDAPSASALSLRDIGRFYYPLALTSVISLITGPLVTFFLGHSRSPIESLAVWPVISAFVFLFRSGGIGYQEVAVALIGIRHQHVPEVRRVAGLLAAAATLALGVIVFTPVADVWFRVVAGLQGDLRVFAIDGARILVLLPALEYLLSFQRARLIVARKTRMVTVATAIEAVCLAAALFLSVGTFNLVGALAAAVAVMLGRLAANAYLLSPASTSARG
ncbi:MAG: hypothetical protein NTV05_17045 [Acidobacteria bacterium]|nr:hypothetical protein [Acidobacteriota bacterium]